MLLIAEYVVPVSSEPIEHGAILVQDGAIADIGDADVMRLRYPEEEVKDFGMAALTPGFIDLHARMEDAVFRGLVSDAPFAEWRKEIASLRKRISYAEAFDSAFLGGLEMLSSGVTTVSDITETGACVTAANRLGLRGVFYREAGAIDKRLVHYAIKKADNDLEKWAGEVDTSRITLGVAPAPVYECHPEMYREIARYAGQNGNLPIAMDLAGSLEEYRFVKYGVPISVEEDPGLQGFMEVPPWMPTAVTPVNYVLNWGLFDAENVMIVYAVRVTDEDIRHLRDYNVAIAACPTLNAQLGMGVAPVSEYLRAGMRVGLGTGAPSSIDSMDIFSEMRTELLLQRSLTGEFLGSKTLLEMGTLGAARALGIDDKVGSLEVGKRADIVAMDLSGSHQTPTADPVSALVGAASNSDVVMTMVDGKVLFEQGRLHVEGGVAKNIAHVLQIRGRLRS